MKGIVWHGPEEMSFEEVPEPAVEPGTVVVRPTATGICGSEIEGYLGRMGNRTPPLVMGHEFAGTVTEVGEGVDQSVSESQARRHPLPWRLRGIRARARDERISASRWRRGTHGRPRRASRQWRPRREARAR